MRKPNSARRFAPLAIVLVLAFCGEKLVLAQQPRIPSPYLRGVFPPGAKAGANVSLKIVRGEFLEGADRLVFSHPGITAKQTMREPDKFFPEPRPVADAFSVAVGTAVPPGVYEVRAAVGSRLSNARKFIVEANDAFVEEEPNDEPAKANDIGASTVVYGAFEKGYDYYKLKLKAGERVLLDCQAERIDSRGDAAMFVCTVDGQELARSQNAVGRDPVIDFTAPAAGEYCVCVYDMLFSGEGDSAATPYRLALGRGPWIEFADPPIVPRGAATQVTLYGHNLGGSPSEVKLAGRPLEKLAATINAPADPGTLGTPADVLLGVSSGGIDFVTYRQQTPSGLSNAIAIAIGDGLLSAEKEPNNSFEQAQVLSLPCDLLGHFDAARDTDRYLFTAKKGDKLWIEAISNQLGLPTSPLIAVQRVVRGENGKLQVTDLARINRRKFEIGELRLPIEFEDPGEMFTVPDDGEYCLVVKDSFGSSHGGPQFAYRLRVGQPQPDFRVLAMADAEAFPENNNQMRSRAGLIKRGGGIEVLIVVMRREGYNGEITVALDSPPAGLSAEALVIGPAGQWGELIVRASPDAPPISGPVKIVARGKVGDNEVTRTARAIEVTAQFTGTNLPVPARLTEAVTLAIDDTATVPCHVEESQKQIWRMSRGGKLEIPVKLVKHDANFGGNVNLKVIGRPPGMTGGDLGLGGGNLEGKVALDINQEVVPGKFTLHLRGDHELDYRRNVIDSEQADKDKTRIAQLLQQSEQAMQQAQQAKQQADSLAQQMQSQRDQTREAFNRQQQQAKQFEGEAKQLADKSIAAKKVLDDATKLAADAAAAVAAAPDDNAKQTAQTAAQQAAQQATQAKGEFDNTERQSQEKATQLKTATDELAKTKTAMEEAEKKHTDALAAKEQMTKAEEQSRKDRELAQQVNREAEESANRWRNIAQPARFRVPIQSTPITIEVVPYPATIKLTPSATTVKAGEEVKLVVEAQREFGFMEEITFSIRPPEGFQNPPYFEPLNKIEKGQNAATLPLKIQPTTKPGEYTFEVRIAMNFNGRSLETQQPLKLVIEPKPAP